jgi:VCBS repeat-containing protein
VDDGTFNFNGGTLTTASIAVGSGDEFYGYGTVDGNVSVTGSIGVGSLLDFTGAVSGGGAFTVNGSHSILEFDSTVASTTTVNLQNGGTIELNDPNDFHGTITHVLSGNIDLPNLIYTSDTNVEFLNWTENSQHNAGVLTITDGNTIVTIALPGSFSTGDFELNPDVNTGTEVSNSVSVDPAVPAGTSDVTGNFSFADPDVSGAISASFTPDGNNYLGNFSLDQATDSNGQVSVGFEFMINNDQIDLAPGQTLTQSYAVSVADAQNPAVNLNQTVSVTIGGPGNDNFVFAPGIGEDTITNFNPQQDTIELDHFANAQTVQELQALITTDVHGDAVINLGHNDSITLANVTTPQLLQAIQASHVLLH